MKTLKSPTFAFITAYWLLFVIGGANIIAGVLVYALNLGALIPGLGVLSILFGLAYLALGYFAKQKSTRALVIAIAIYLLNSVVGYVFANTYISSICLPMVQVVVVVLLYRGIAAIRSLQNDGEATVST